MRRNQVRPLRDLLMVLETLPTRHSHRGRVCPVISNFWGLSHLGSYCTESLMENMAGVRFVHFKFIIE